MNDLLGLALVLALALALVAAGIVRGARAARRDAPRRQAWQQLPRAHPGWTLREPGHLEGTLPLPPEALHPLLQECARTGRFPAMPSGPDLVAAATRPDVQVQAMAALMKRQALGPIEWRCEHSQDSELAGEAGLRFTARCGALRLPEVQIGRRGEPPGASDELPLPHPAFARDWVLRSTDPARASRLFDTATLDAWLDLCGPQRGLVRPGPVSLVLGQGQLVLGIDQARHEALAADSEAATRFCLELLQRAIAQLITDPRRGW